MLCILYQMGLVTITLQQIFYFLNVLKLQKVNIFNNAMSKWQWVRVRKLIIWFCFSGFFRVHWADAIWFTAGLFVGDSGCFGFLWHSVPCLDPCHRGHLGAAVRIHSLMVWALKVNLCLSVSFSLSVSLLTEIYLFFHCTLHSNTHTHTHTHTQKWINTNIK